MKNLTYRIGLAFTLCFVLIAIYAPFLRSNLPLLVVYRGDLYSPSLSSLLSPIDFPSLLDRLYNFIAICIPVYLLLRLLRVNSWRENFLVCILVTACICAFSFSTRGSTSTSGNSSVIWENEIAQKTPRERLDLVTRYIRDLEYDAQVRNDLKGKIPEDEIRTPRSRTLESLRNHFDGDSLSRTYQKEREQWLREEARHISLLIWPPLGSVSWYEDIGGSTEQNLNLSLLNQTRRTRQDFLSALLFGLRVSIMVGALTFFLTMIMALPLGLISGYRGGWFDLALCRFVEVWEALPQFLTLLLIISFFETKSIYLIISLLALFGWTGIFRYVRAETLKERTMPYVECLELYGMSKFRILFRHLLPNAIYPVLALAPFEIMAAITRESALSFLGLGDERICSLGILMDEGRLSFPQESILLWPPAILLTLLLIAIAFLGDGLRKSWNVRTKS